MNKLRITGKIVGYFLTVVLIFQAIAIFSGSPIDRIPFGIELIPLSLLIALDTAMRYKKPKYPYVRYMFIYDDGTTEDKIVSNDEPITVKIDKNIKAINIHYFESGKDEVKNEQKN
jgi:hypothetical protein